MQSAVAGSLNYRAMVSALAWRPLAECMPLIESLLNPNEPDYYWLGFICLRFTGTIGRVIPSNVSIERWSTCKKSESFAGTRACGELGRKDLLPGLQTLYLDSDPGCAFWALWSGALLGDKSAHDRLKTCVFAKTEYAEPALALLMRLLSMGELFPTSAPARIQRELLREWLSQ